MTDRIHTILVDDTECLCESLRKTFDDISPQAAETLCDLLYRNAPAYEFRLPSAGQAVLETAHNQPSTTNGGK